MKSTPMIQSVKVSSTRTLCLYSCPRIRSCSSNAPSVFMRPPLAVLKQASVLTGHGLPSLKTKLKMCSGMHVIAEPVSKSQLIVMPLMETLILGRWCTPLKGFIMSEILFTVAIDKAHKEKIRFGITVGAYMRGFT